MKEQDLGVKWFNTIFYPARHVTRAYRYEDGVLPRLRQPIIQLFTPWGPRYSWQKRGDIIKPEDKEVETLAFLADVIKEWQVNMPRKNFQWLFLGADLYGTRVNQLPETVVSNYFTNLKEWIRRLLPETDFHLWSEFDKLAEPYRQRIKDNFNEYFNGYLLGQAAKTAEALKSSGGFKDYLTERLAEAMLIEGKFRPIKISCADPCKDATVDWELPRLYLLPPRLHAPWL